MSRTNLILNLADEFTPSFDTRLKPRYSGRTGIYQSHKQAVRAECLAQQGVSKHERINTVFFWLTLAVCLFVLSACDAPKLPSPFHASDVTSKFSQVNFHLTDQYGQARTLADFHDKAVVLFFGYTHCPDVCPTTLADLAQVMRTLGKDSDKVQVLFITLDPERDTPELLSKYVAMFNPTFLALSGNTQATAQAAKSFDVSYQKQPTTSGYSLDHSDGSFLIDTKGRVRLLAAYPLRSDWLVQDIKLLLAGV